jgi:hypothetical protein
METINLVTDGAVMAEMLRGRSGAVNLFMTTRADIVKRAAVIQCNKKTGKLSQSIVKRPSSIGGEISYTIGAYQPYAIYVHNGTKPHIIKAKNKPYLVFFWPNGPTGAHVYKMKQVTHLGYKGNKFLTDNLRLFFAY